MKEFMRTLKQVYLVGWKDLLGFSLYSVLGGIFGIILTFVILAIDGSGENYGQIGALMALVIGAMVFLFGGIFSMANDFNLAISMGKTRKYYVPAKFLMLVLGIIMLMVVSVAVGLIEDMLYAAIYPGIVCELSFSKGLLNLPVFLSIAFIGAMLVLLFGALILRFTNKVYVFIWAVWMICTMGFSKMASAVGENEDSLWGQIGRSMVDFVKSATVMELILIVCCVVASGLAAAFGFLRKQRVTT